MDKKRREAYINLIGQLLNSPSGEAKKILQTNQELVDEGLLEIMDFVHNNLQKTMTKIIKTLLIFYTISGVSLQNY